MAKKLNRGTPLSDIPNLSPESCQILRAQGYEELGDLDGSDFAQLGPLVATDKERKALYEATLKSGIGVRFQRRTRLVNVPSLSSRTVQKLQSHGFQFLEDLESEYFPRIWELIGYGPGKQLLVALSLASLKVCFEEPDWTEEEWKEFVQGLVSSEVVSWEDIAVAVCAELNPPQVGTAVAIAVKGNYSLTSNPDYAPGSAMQSIWRWLYAQDGTCAVSGKRLFLEVDHQVPKELFIKQGKDPREADTLENMQLLTKRENVIKRGSHKLGGLSFAPAAAVLIYILMRFRPPTYAEFVTLCRAHGLTMSNIRFQEAWSFAVWLSRVGKYRITGDPTPFITER